MSNPTSEGEPTPYQKMRSKQEAEAAVQNVRIVPAEHWERGSFAFNASPGKRKVFNRDAQKFLSGGVTLYYRAQLGPYPDFAPTGYRVYMSTNGDRSAGVVGEATTPEAAIELGRAVLRALRSVAHTEVEK